MAMNTQRSEKTSLFLGVKMEKMLPGTVEGRRPRQVWWILASAIMVSCVYLPSMRARFDFIDDSDIVHPVGPMSLSGHLEHVWTKIQCNYEALGPFRPVLWAHWKTLAELNHDSEVAWRLSRLFFCVLSATMLIWLMRELDMAPAACVVAAAIAIWNPYRSEIWTSNSLAEGVAMPYALFALIAARRAAASKRPCAWDVAGMLCVLAAMGCKNIFVALLPAQVFLRFAVDGLSLREGWRLHGRRALLLSLTAIAPVVHYIYFKLHWHPGQYVTPGPSLAQFRRLLMAYQGAIGLDFLGIGLAFVLCLTFIAVRRQRAEGLADPGIDHSPETSSMADIWATHRAALVCGLLSIGAGIVIYLPLDSMSARYVMPGIWGLDILLALVLTRFLAIPDTKVKKAAWVTLGAGLFAVACANVGKQEKHVARTKMLWETLEWVETHVPAGTHIAWHSGGNPRTALNVEEGVHFAWHLQARKRIAIEMSLFDDKGQPLERPELPVQAKSRPIEMRIVGPDQASHDDAWRPDCRFVEPYWAGRRKHECIVERPAAYSSAAWRLSSR